MPSKSARRVILAVVVSIASDEVRVEIEDPAAVHPAWVAELARALRRGESA